MRASRARPPAALGAAPHQDDLAALQTELARVRGEREQLHAVLADVLAELAQLGIELAQTQAQLAAVEAERQEVHQELVDLKRKPFAAQRRIDDVPSTKPRGRPIGHPGSGRSQPLRIDHTPPIPVGQTCPDCGSAFSGAGTSRERVIEDIDLVRPTIVTKYVIERRWCPQCRAYREDAVTTALPRYRLGLHVLLFVVYQKLALGLNYSKIQHELRTYFGLTVSSGELPRPCVLAQSDAAASDYPCR